MLATLSHDVPAGPEWVFEEKYDGLRGLAVRRSGKVRLYSRTLHEFDFPDIATSVSSLPGQDLVLDGEIVVLDRHRVSRFQAIQRSGAARYAVFDLLEEERRSLLARPLAERRTALERVVPERRGTLFLARRLPRDGAKALAIARDRGWEGVIAKHERSVYTPGTRSRDWRKLKLRKEAEFVIGGYTAPAGAREHLGALLVGLYDGERLRYTGKVGTGFTGETLRTLATKLGPLRTDRPPFDPPPREHDVTWVRPRLVAQLAYAEWTADGKLRHPAFLGLRTDKSPRECRWSEREP